MAGKNKKSIKKPLAKKPVKKAAKPVKASVAKKTPLKKVAAKAAPIAKGTVKGTAKSAPKGKVKAKIEIKSTKVIPPEAKGKKLKESLEKGAPVAAVAAPEDVEIVLTDSEGRRYCRVKDCDQLATVDGYCRYHYLLHWKRIQVRKKILSEGKLERYIEDLTARYPDKFLDMLRKDLRSDKEFLSAIAELEIDESAVENEFEDEAQNYLDEVRGMNSETPNAGSGDDDF